MIPAPTIIQSVTCSTAVAACRYSASCGTQKRNVLSGAVRGGEGHVNFHVCFATYVHRTGLRVRTFVSPRSRRCSTFVPRRDGPGRDASILETTTMCLPSHFGGSVRPRTYEILTANTSVWGLHSRVACLSHVWMTAIGTAIEQIRIQYKTNSWHRRTKVY